MFGIRINKAHIISLYETRDEAIEAAQETFQLTPDGPWEIVECDFPPSFLMWAQMSFTGCDDPVRAPEYLGFIYDNDSMMEHSAYPTVEDVEEDYREYVAQCLENSQGGPSA